MSSARIPPIQCLLTFEALARLRSVTLAAEEQCVTPSAVSHRVRQLEEIIGTKLFGRADFSLTTDGSEYLAHVREGLASLERFPGRKPAYMVTEYMLRRMGCSGIAFQLCHDITCIPGPEHAIGRVQCSGLHAAYIAGTVNSQHKFCSLVFAKRNAT